MEGKLRILKSKRESLFERMSSIFELSKRLSNLDSRTNENFMAESETIEEMQTKFEVIVDEINEIQLLMNSESQPDFKYLNAFGEIYSRVKRARNNIIYATKNEVPPAPTTIKIHLPPIDIPSFDGRTENWPIFYESFKANIHSNPQLTNSQRVQYLMGKLTHNALKFVVGIIPTGETYEIIWNNLIRKYQDKRALGIYYLNNILEVKNCVNTAPSLNTFIEKFAYSVAALKSLNIEDMTSFILLHCALRRVDFQVVQAFELSVRDNENPSYESFIRFVQDHVKILERANNNSYISSSSRSSGTVNKSDGLNARTYKTFIASNDSHPQCSLCNKTDHSHIYKCAQFKNMFSPQARFEFIKSHNGCINCLSLSHKMPACKSSHFCFHCNKRHHSLLHFNDSSASVINSNAAAKPVRGAVTPGVLPRGQSPPIPQVNTTISLSSESKSCSILLSTAQVYAYYNEGDRKIIRCLIDNGSQNNLITVECCKSLNIPIMPLSNSCIKGVGLTSRPIHGYIYLNIASRVSAHKYYIYALVVDCITDKLPAHFIHQGNMKYLDNLPLADLTWNTPGGIDLVIGAQLFPYIYLGNRIDSGSSAPPAIETHFGYVLMGEIPVFGIEPSPQAASFSAVALNDLEACLHKFWELEEIPSKRFLSPEETECENLYTASVSRDTNGRYSVSLPFCRNPADLGKSKSVAHRRFLALERKFQQAPTLRENYNKVIQEFIDNGYLSEVPTCHHADEGYYIPHHAIIRLDKATTKLRVVLDASAKTNTGLSLNDVVHAGPNLQADLFMLLLNFRLFPIAITADIKQMYMQIDIPQPHRKYLKILFRFADDEQIRVLQFNRLPFGLKSSPYLAMRTVRQLASDECHRFPNAAKAATAELYMDDLVTSVPDDNTAINLSHELISLFKSGGFDLVKWASSSTALCESLPKSHRASIDFSSGNNNNITILGLAWHPSDDAFYISTRLIDTKCTKRSILSLVARLFDVLGLVAPVILYAKLLIKELWKCKIDWDETPPDSITKRFTSLVKEMHLLSNLIIPRHIGVSNGCTVNLVAFCDASLNAYGCVIYLYAMDSAGNVTVRLLCSKSKVSPVKITTLARLELCAAVLLAKLVKVVHDSYSSRIHITGIYAFSDSTIALSWIHSPPHKWSIFVGNRVAQCQDNLHPQNFYHIAGVDNPSDCLSRGMLPSQLISHRLWWNGPAWMHYPCTDWPIKPFSPGNYEQIPEYKSNTLTATVQCEQSIWYNLSQRISSWGKLLRIVVYVLRFMKKLPRAEALRPSDLIAAEIIVIRSVQRIHFSDELHLINKSNLPSKNLRSICPFIDEEGILRIEGRLSKSDLPFEAQHPALLPKHDHVVGLIVDHYHQMNCHTGPNLLMSILRQRFWIISARNVVRKRVRMCNTCFRLSPSHPSPKMADLPPYRIREAKAFVHTGVDYAGPIKVTLSRRRGQHSQKAYICLFICLTTKAVHIELVSDLTSDAFLAAFKRFISRRGPVSCIYSDNGTNFVGAKAQLDDMYRFMLSNSFKTTINQEFLKHRIEWKLLPPRAPHFGGIWESNIKSLKTHLYRVIGAQLLSYEELLTVLVQIEGLLNSRPLCLLSADPQPELLTPANFLMSTPLQYLPASDLSNERISLTNRKKLLDSLVQSYWKKWRLEYLHTLQIRQKWCTPDNPVTVGTVVLLHQDDIPPLRWPIGIIQEIYKGSDNVVRVALVRTSSGTFKRPVIKLYPVPTQ